MLTIEGLFSSLSVQEVSEKLSVDPAQISKIGSIWIIEYPDSSSATEAKESMTDLSVE